MREIIQQVMEAEAEAQRVLDAAQAEAERIVAEARTQAHEHLASARLTTRAAAEDSLLHTEQAAQLEKKVRLDKAIRDIEQGVQLDEDLKQAAIAAVVQCVSGGG